LNPEVVPKKTTEPKCILHVGTPKTGTSSIQESLFHGLEDPRFHYVSLGHLQAAMFLAACFLDRPEDFWIFRARGYSSTRIRMMRQAFEWRLRRALDKAKRAAQTPILSAELGWMLPASALMRLRDFLTSEGFGVAVFAYLRPIKSWMESGFQQHNKVRWTPFLPYQTPRNLSPDAPYSYSRKLSIFGDLFGRENLTVRSFIRSNLASGCVVQDFCSTAGIHLSVGSIRRSNDSLSAEATRLLYVHHHFSREAARIPLEGRFRTLKALETLKGSPIRFHSSVFDPIKSVMEFETSWVGHEFGIDISEDVEAADGGPCIRQEADLFQFSEETLDWLAHASGTACVRERAGESAARAVALQMDRLFRSPLVQHRWEMLREKVHARLRWIRKGD